MDYSITSAGSDNCLMNYINYYGILIIPNYTLHEKYIKQVFQKQIVHPINKAKHLQDTDLWPALIFGSHPFRFTSF